MLEFDFDFKQRVEFMRFKFAGYKRERDELWLNLILNLAYFTFALKLFKHFKSSFCLNFVVLNLNFCANLAFIQAILFYFNFTKIPFYLKVKIRPKDFKFSHFNIKAY